MVCLLGQDGDYVKKKKNQSIRVFMHNSLVGLHGICKKRNKTHPIRKNSNGDNYVDEIWETWIKLM